MRAPLVIAVAQPPSVSHDVAHNAERHADAVASADARVVVFPELSLTGYELDAGPITPADPRLQPLVDMCGSKGALALAGAPVRGDDARRHIAMLAVDGNGARVVYRKIWLGDAEAERFSPGDAPAVLDLDGWRLGLAICKDTGIERHAGDTAALGIDAYVSGTVKHSAEAQLQRERAVRVATEHSIWVAIASHAGPTGGGFAETAGGSGIWGPDGGVIVDSGREPGELARATLA
jgi:predicted amidohydrolase